jgi:hypothetical protein
MRCPDLSRLVSTFTASATAAALAATSACASLQGPTPYVADPRLDFPVFAHETRAGAGDTTDTDRPAATDADALGEGQARHVAAIGFGRGDRDGEDPTIAHVAGDAEHIVGSDAIHTASGEVLQADGAPARDLELDPRWRKASPALFWTGIAVGSLGGAFLIGGGITGSVTQRQVRDAYEDGATKADIDRRVARGEVANDFVIAGSVLALAGYALAVVVAGIDEKRCGSVLRKARRRECERR